MTKFRQHQPTIFHIVVDVLMLEPANLYSIRLADSINPVFKNTQKTSHPRGIKTPP